MHANLSITDGVYGILSEMNVREQIANLGQAIIKQDFIDVDLFANLVVKKLRELERW